MFFMKKSQIWFYPTKMKTLATTANNCSEKRTLYLFADKTSLYHILLVFPNSMDKIKAWCKLHLKKNLFNQIHF